MGNLLLLVTLITTSIVGSSAGEGITQKLIEDCFPHRGKMSDIDVNSCFSTEGEMYNSEASLITECELYQNNVYDIKKPRVFSISIHPYDRHLYPQNVSFSVYSIRKSLNHVFFNTPIDLIENCNDVTLEKSCYLPRYYPKNTLALIVPRATKPADRPWYCVWPVVEQKEPGRVCKSHQKPIFETFLRTKPTLASTVPTNFGPTKTKCVACMSQPQSVLDLSRVCDGIIDCEDLSDECLCPNRPGICQRMTLDVQHEPYFICASPTQEMLVIDVTMACDGRADCSDGSDESGCERNDVLETSGQSELEEFLTCSSVMFRAECNKTAPEYSICLPIEEEFCKDLKSLDDMDQLHKYALCSRDATRDIPLCDGKQDCDSLLDEAHCKSTRFYCTDGLLPNIPLMKRCDGIDDCPNGEDERGCPHFYCDDNGTIKYIPQIFKADGVEDCESGSDECDSVDSVFSDETSMISNKIVLAFVWIMCICGITGCFVVIIITLRDLTRPWNSQLRFSNHTQLFKILILSLSISDFLVAVYTFVICLKAFEFDHDYCKTDRRWRSSSACSSLGVILMIGSEQSVFTMVLIAVLRTYFVWRPLAKPKMCTAMLAVLLTWTISIILATTPLIPSAEDYFVKRMEIKGSVFPKVVSNDEVQYMINWLSMMPNVHIVGTTKWSKLRNLLEAYDSSIESNEFGYYSSHAVCLPSIFPNRSGEPAWGYTFLILIINFLAFCAILMLYVMLYGLVSRIRHVRELDDAQNKARQENLKMQGKLTRIVVSDFLCWMPICIMGFLQISGVTIPKEAYLPAGLFIIPINSALNPFLYSDIPEFMMRKLKEAKKRCASANRKSSHGCESHTLNYFAVAEHVEKLIK